MTMKSLFTPAIFLLAAASLAFAAPVGICLHAYSPEAPADKIECFEFESSERFGADYRFFINPERPAVVTSYRYRGTIPYKTGLAPGNPEFDKQLKLYEEASRSTPSTRRYLNPKILAMREQSAQVAKQAEKVAKLSTITMPDGTLLIGCTMSKIENGFVSIRHQDGISKVSLKELDSTEKKALNSTADNWSLEDPSATPKDSTGTFAKIVFKNGLLVKKAKFKEVSDGNLVFMADGKSVSVPVDQFPGELSVLGEEAMKSLAQAKKQASPEPPSVASFGGDGPTPSVISIASEINDIELRIKKRAEALASAQEDPNKLAEEGQHASSETAHTKKKYSTNELETLAYYRSLGLGENEATLMLSSISYHPKKEKPEMAMLVIAANYENGAGVKLDPLTAMKWLFKSADAGSTEAMCRIGMIFAPGFPYRHRGYPDENAHKSFQWYLKAAELESCEGMDKVGSIYWCGRAVSDC